MMKLDNEHSIVILELRDHGRFEAQLMKTVIHDNHSEITTSLYTSDPFPSEDRAAVEALIYYMTHIKANKPPKRWFG